MAEFDNLGKATLDLEANLTEFERNMAAGRGSAERMEHALESVATVSRIAEEALHQVKMHPGQGATSQVSAEAILHGVRGIKDESREAARELDRVHLSEIQAAESEVAGSLISRVLNRISRNADEAKRKLVEVKVAGGVPGRSGVGVGPFGSGFGRVGVLGAAIGVGALTAPAAAPAAVGLLAAIPTLAFAGAGAIGTLALAFKGMGAAIGGDKKAFDKLTPTAQQFVQTLRGLHGWIGGLKQTAQTAMFPGLTAGLHAALSPGTVGAITKAVAEFGQAIGQAGSQWGRYFGSAGFQKIFGPLMQAGARSFGLLSNALLHLFDALGVIGRAAIPLVNWINTGIAQGSRLADSWVRTQAASGGLARGMNEAKTSLRLVGQLALALLRVVGALGRAIYPLSKIAVKALTDGLNALSQIINHNRAAIRTVISTALTGLVTSVKLAAGAVKLLVNGLAHFVGHKHAVVAAVGAIGIALTLALGPQAAAVTGAILAVGLITKHWHALRQFYWTLCREIRNAFRWVWVQIEHGGLIAALKIVEPFSHLPGKLGAWARRAKVAMQRQVDGLHAPNMDWSAAAAQAGYKTGAAWVAGHKAGRATVYQVGTKAPPGYKPGSYGSQPSSITNPGGFMPLPSKIPDKDPANSTDTTPDKLTPGTHAWYMKNLGYDPTDTSPFGKPPPFDKNLGPKKRKPPVIPAAVSHLEALASQEASRASALGNTGKVAKRHLDKELADLQKADKLLEAKYKTAHGTARTQLFSAITSVENKIRTVRERVAKALKHEQTSRADQLALAVNQAKLAVENAKKGTHAYDRAVAAEERALRAEIRYWDKRAHNIKLSAKKRDQAVRQEIADKRQLKALLKPELTGAAGANEAQFLSSFAQIVSAFAPNAFPGQGGGGKTDTHLYDIKHEARKTNRHLHEIKTQSKFPATARGLAAAGAVGG